MRDDEDTFTPNEIRFAVASPKPATQVFPMLRFCLVLFLGVITAQAGSNLHIAAAANLAHVIEPLTTAFQNEQPDATTKVTLGSSGSLVAQITHGAPFDIFLSADKDYPRSLIANDHAIESSLTPFANGRLVLWTTNPKIQLSEPKAAIIDPHLHRIALANPDTAPFGRAAREVITKLNLTETLSAKLIIGENVSQAVHFVATGNADLGFVAMSLVLAPPLKDQGHWIEIPDSWHAPLTQCAVITKHGEQSHSAKNFLNFLQSPAARKIFARHGYHVPSQPDV